MPKSSFSSRGVHADLPPRDVVACQAFSTSSTSMAMTRWADSAGALSLGGLIDQAFQTLGAGLPDPR